MKIVLLLLAALGALAVAGLVFFRRSLPEVSGDVTVSGVSGPLELVRDRHGIPHIYAQSVDDAYFGLGYVHAQDRSWQMEVNRRVGSGTLSEVFGPEALGQDRWFRALGLRRVAEENLAHLGREARAALDAYARGVNAFLEEGRPLPPEFVLFGVEPARWTPADSLVWLKVMAWGLSANWERELLRVRLGGALTPRQVAELLAPYPGDAPVLVPALPALHGALGPAVGALLAAVPLRGDRAAGSNNWAVDGARTESGKPLLANDPHLDLTAPSLWYFAHLSAPSLNVIGATLPGLPAVLLGRNDRVAWAFTNTESDTQDLFIEKLVPSDPTHYLTPDGPRPFTTVREPIKVKGKPDEVLEIRVSRHGPVVSDVSEAVKRLVPEGHVLSLSWASLRADDATFSFPVKAALARSSAEVLEATRDFHSPQQNITFADVDGEIGFIAAGRVPMRRADNDLKGLVPSPGWLEQYDWAGFVPWEELPRSRSPASGRIVTANHKVTPPGYPHWITSEWDHPYRAERITALLDATARHSVQSFAAIQMDVRSGTAELLLPALLRAASPTSEAQRALLDRLRAWDLQMRAGAAEPLIFAAWLRELSRQIYEDELGDLFGPAFGERLAFLRNVLSDVDGQARWCDDVRTEPRESCDEAAGRAFQRAIAYLEERYGGDPATWSWGAAHPARSQHAVLGGVPVLSRWFDVEVASAGDNHTINLGGYSIGDEDGPFVSRSGPGFRAIYDLGDPERSVFMLSTGQSGHPLSPRYRDFGEPWAAGEHVPMVTRRDAVERDALGTLRLRPR
ncbi:penicillin acylase family protein [Sorangium sp. So ce327]|jgi:penicillin amidase|uniref:penicillin acylase family protein n=1 Tax=Sorangium sp. So ce327 TaxID=3133301 RepID=UPI003F635212